MKKTPLCGKCKIFLQCSSKVNVMNIDDTETLFNRGNPEAGTMPYLAQKSKDSQGL